MVLVVKLSEAIPATGFIPLELCVTGVCLDPCV